MGSLLKKAVSAMMATSMLLSFGACSAKDAFEGITLTESQRAWSNPDAKYKAVLDEYDEISRGKIKLGSQEYLKAETVISIGDMHVCYYARKIDDDVIFFMSISFPKNRTAEEFEKCFE